MRRRYRRRRLFNTRRRSSSGFGSLIGVLFLVGALVSPFSSHDDKPKAPTPTPRITAVVQTATPSPRPSASPSPTPKIVTATPNPEIRDYVLNINTMKFHRPQCKYVPTIKQKNRKDFTGTRTKIIDMGFIPCKGCDP